MPGTYNYNVVQEFTHQHLHMGRMLGIYKQDLACRIIDILRSKKAGMKPADIRKGIGHDIKDFVLSRVLGYLKNEHIIAISESRYTLQNDLLYRLLMNINLVLNESPSKKISFQLIRDNAEIFHTLFLDDINNMLIHLLLDGPKSFDTLLKLCNADMGYMAPSTLRYRLEKTISIYGKDMPIFRSDGSKYFLSEPVREVHTIFDKFVEKYDADVEEKIKKLYGHKLSDLAIRDMTVISPMEPINRILHMIRYSRYLLVMSTKPEGLLTINSFINSLPLYLDKDIPLSKLRAKDLMRPISEDEILSGEMTLPEAFKAKKMSSVYNQYVVDAGGTYRILDFLALVNSLPDI